MVINVPGLPVPNGSNLRSKRKDPPCADNISVS